MSSETQTLILAGNGYELSIAPEAEAQKAELLKRSALIVEIKDPTAFEAARNELKKLAAMRNLVEKSRKTVKEPVLQVGKEIDAKAADFTANLNTEEKRVTKLMADYSAEVEEQRQRALREIEAKRAAEAKAAAEAEAARIKAEQEAEKARQEAEEKRKAAEAAMWEEDGAEAAKAKEEADKAAEAARVVAEREAALAAEQAAALAAAAATPIQVVPQAVSGTKFVPDYEVEDIHALYQHNAGLVTVTERRSEILDCIKRMTIGDDLPKIPGLRIFKRPVVSTR